LLVIQALSSMDPTLALGLVSGIGIPVLIYMLRQHSEDLKGKIKHLDECLDRLRVNVLEGAATKEDLGNSEARLGRRLDDATKGLHDRIMRLESAYFDDKRRGQ
jgi:hypothetical protein